MREMTCNRGYLEHNLSVSGGFQGWVFISAHCESQPYPSQMYYTNPTRSFHPAPLLGLFRQHSPLQFPPTKKNTNPKAFMFYISAPFPTSEC